MALEKFEIGKTYRVREYEDLKREFGANCDGNIKCGEIKMLLEWMSRTACGREFIVKPELFDKTGFLKLIVSRNISWYITPQMCELVESEQEESK